jgi:hypothetical protein
MLSALCLSFTPRVKAEFRKSNKTNLQLRGGVSAQRNLEANVKREKMPWSLADFKFSLKNSLRCGYPFEILRISEYLRHAGSISRVGENRLSG